MNTVAEHSHKDTDMNIAVSLRRRSIAISIQGRNIAVRIAVSIRSRNIAGSIRCRNVHERKPLGNTGNNNLNINRR